MKKQLEKELQELAQSIIDTKDNLDLPNLKKEAEKLLEKVTILNFVTKYYNSVGSSEERLQYTMKKVADFIEEDQDENDIFNLPVKTTQVQKLATSQPKKSTPEVAVAKVEEKEEILSKQVAAKSNHSMDSLSAYKAYQQNIAQKSVQETEPQHIVQEKIEKPITQIETFTEEDFIEETITKVPKKQPLEDFISQTKHPVFEKKEDTDNRTPSLNDKFGKATQIGLNDKLAFIRQLFFGSESEYNNVVQHINSLESVQDIAVYIEQEIKPIYNHWRGKEDYEERFLSLMLKRFEV
ncbi:MAG: hypothetical protein Q4C98_00635 [Capnocytophaga sp.]|nr:hypothetical protein [Capnocytophaga sp.]